MLKKDCIKSDTQNYLYSQLKQHLAMHLIILTDNQILISGYNVDPFTASIEFEMTAALAREVKGNYTKIGGSNNLAYQLIQSFSPEIISLLTIDRYLLFS
ncbi:hypothetical protein EFD62_00025 [Acetivibrio mesophilus]|uniref:Uncharacterized protein n=1 Tax=Acetivibrio mesophilus TaxID=2487273 RepID=A0A4Q0I8U2_9FIRM|nr:hypothetical protein A7W90_09970 [Clostridium sp. Bc-iso-3]RXE60365.1 hypothetical protein EFD62_00025 [Acetivibrio mesophilus]